MLPIKWMAFESMQDHIYNHKTDVWSVHVNKMVWRDHRTLIKMYIVINHKVIRQPYATAVCMKSNERSNCSLIDFCLFQGVLVFFSGRYSLWQ